MHDLKDLTHDFHYENYRTEYIKAQKNAAADVVPQQTSFKSRPNEETDRLLQQKELELKKMQDLIAKMKSNMNFNNSTTSTPNPTITTNYNSNNSSQHITTTISNNPVLLSFTHAKNANIKTQGNSLINRHLTSYNTTSANADTSKQANSYIQNLSSFQSLTNSTPI